MDAELRSLIKAATRMIAVATRLLENAQMDMMEADTTKDFSHQQVVDTCNWIVEADESKRGRIVELVHSYGYARVIDMPTTLLRKLMKDLRELAK